MAYYLWRVPRHRWKALVGSTALRVPPLSIPLCWTSQKKLTRIPKITRFFGAQATLRCRRRIRRAPVGVRRRHAPRKRGDADTDAPAIGARARGREVQGAERGLELVEPPPKVPARAYALR